MILPERMSEQMVSRFIEEDMAMDEEIRRKFHIPENRFYSVALSPADKRGQITVDRERVVQSRKISKSDL